MSGGEERFMHRALELALSAPFTSPNPRVGAVLVRDGRIIGEGAHLGVGSPHAEAVALQAAGDARGATAFVTLEPCNHKGHTPPCAPALVEAGVSRVVIALVDPDERVSGSGLDLLRDAGLVVETGLLEERARSINAAYLHHRTTGRAFLTLKLALSIDGRLGAADGSSRWITGAEARTLVHRRRLEADAVMVGSGTIVADDPELTVRAVPAARQPVAVVVDGSGGTPPGSAVFRGHDEVIVATHPGVPHENQLAWKEAGAEVLVLPSPDPEGGVDVAALLRELGRRGMVEVYCEGGARLATRLLALDLVDRLEVHRGAVVIGEGGPSIGSLGSSSMSDATRWRLTSSQALGDDLVTTYERRVG